MIPCNVHTQTQVQAAIAPAVAHFDYGRVSELLCWNRAGGATWQLTTSRGVTLILRVRRARSYHLPVMFEDLSGFAHVAQGMARIDVVEVKP